MASIHHPSWTRVRLMTCVGLSLAASRTNINRPYSELHCPQSVPVPVPTQIGSLISIACDWFAENQSIGQSINRPSQAKQSKASKQSKPPRIKALRIIFLVLHCFTASFFVQSIRFRPSGAAGPSFDVLPGTSTTYLRTYRQTD